MLFTTMKVLLVQWAHHRRLITGVSLYAHRLAKGLRKSGYDVYTVSTDRFSARGVPSLTRSGKDFLYSNPPAASLDSSSPLEEVYNEISERYFRELLCKVRPDWIHFVHLRGWPASILVTAREFTDRVSINLVDHYFLCPLATVIPTDGNSCYSRTSIKCHYCFNPKLEEEIRYRNRKFLELFRQTISVAFICSSVSKEVFLSAGYPSSRITVLPYGATLPKSIFPFLPWNHNHPLTIGYTASASPHKGFSVITNAFKYIPKNLNIVLRIHNKHLSISSVQDSRILTAGPYDDRSLLRIHRELHLVAVPSIFPDLGPQTIFQSFACGIPVLGSNIGGIPGLVTHKRNGWLVEAGDPKNLAEMIKYIYSHPEHYLTVRKGVIPPPSWTEYASLMAGKVMSISPKRISSRKNPLLFRKIAGILTCMDEKELVKTLCENLAGRMSRFDVRWLVWGAGRSGSAAARALLKLGARKISVTDQSEIASFTLRDVTFLSPSKIRSDQFDFVFIASAGFSEEIRSNLLAKGFKRENILDLTDGLWKWLS